MIDIPKTNGNTLFLLFPSRLAITLFPLMPNNNAKNCLLLDFVIDFIEYSIIIVIL